MWSQKPLGAVRHRKSQNFLGGSIPLDSAHYNFHPLQKKNPVFKLPTPLMAMIHTLLGLQISPEL